MRGRILIRPKKTFLPAWGVWILKKKRRGKLELLEGNNRELAQELNDAKEQICLKTEEIEILNGKLLSNRADLIQQRKFLEAQVLEFFRQKSVEDEIKLKEIFIPGDDHTHDLLSSPLPTSPSRSVEDIFHKRRQTNAIKRTTELEPINEEDTQSSSRSIRQFVKEIKNTSTLSNNSGSGEEFDYDIQLTATTTQTFHSNLTSTPFHKSNSSCSVSRSGHSRGANANEQTQHGHSSAASRQADSLFSVEKLINSTPYRRMQQESRFIEPPLSERAQQEILQNIMMPDAFNVTFGLHNYQPPMDSTPSIFDLPNHQSFNATNNETEPSQNSSVFLNQTYKVLSKDGKDEEVAEVQKNGEHEGDEQGEKQGKEEEERGQEEEERYEQQTFTPQSESKKRKTTKRKRTSKKRKNENSNPNEQLDKSSQPKSQKRVKRNDTSNKSQRTESTNLRRSERISNRK